ncbi:MAG: FAD-dependent oxidoreductase [Deltaproteobacteria bacterium]|nr:FAD-dependent oxidoreductase [Deltaproteobacteria bacterium]
MKLFTPIQIGPLRLKNRVVMPAMHLNYTPEAYVTDRLIHFYAERAAGGVSLIIAGGCAVDEVSGGRFMIGINQDEFIPGLARLAERVHDQGALIAAQLYHAGRYAHSALIGQQSISPSPVRSTFTREIPREMTQEDIKNVIQRYADATGRAREAGMDAVEILGAAGYLIPQFLSPITNLRQDEYGGSLENRMRFGLEVADSVIEAAGPDMAVIFRLAGNDFMPGSNTNAEAAQFAATLEATGIDCFNVTGGWHETRVPQLPMDLPRGGFAYLAQGIIKKVSLPVMACNRINHPDVAERILRQGRADLVGVARGMIADPKWVNKAQAGKADQISLCIGCNQGCFDSVFTGQPIRCLVNPRAGEEERFQIKPSEEKKDILVAGGGPAGLTFARTAAEQGHRVTLYEQADRLGGQIHLAAALRERQELLSLIPSLSAQAEAARVKIILGKAVDPELIAEENPDMVVIATGGRPKSATLPGADRPHVVQAWDVLAGRAEVGEKAVVIGGGAVGCEAALHLGRIGTLTPDELYFLFVNQAETTEVLNRLTTQGLKDITLLEMQNRIGNDIGRSMNWIVRQNLKRAGIKVRTGAKALEITATGVLMEKNKEVVTIPTDTVVLALGTDPVDDLYRAVKDKHPRILLLGDASQPAKAYEAVHEAFIAALEV